MKKLNLFIILMFLFTINSKINAYNEYKIGDEVSYNNVEYYVIKDSGSNDDVITLLKKEPFTTAEVEKYGVGHINMYILPTDDNYQKVFDMNGYGGMVYYTSENCGFVNNHMVLSECTADYNKSDVKYVVDAWANDFINEDDIYNIRLITFDELHDNLGYTDNSKQCTGGCWYEKSVDVPSFVYNNSYTYWTMTNNNDDGYSVWYVRNTGVIDRLGGVFTDYYTIRPVIELKKSAIEPVDEDIIDDNSNSNKEKKEDIINVVVPNTLKVMSLIFVVIGIILVIISVILIIIKKYKKIKK